MAALIQHFAANTVGRDFVVGDIHGCFTVFERLLAAIGFDANVDRMFSVGDLTDRGPENERALAFIESDWLFSVRGNHEQMCLAAATDGPNQAADRKLWHMNGGNWFDSISQVQQARFVSTFANLPYVIELETPDGGFAGVVHADVAGDSWSDTCALVENESSPAALADLVWSRDRVADLGASRFSFGRDSGVAVADVDVVYFGHTPLSVPTASANTRWLDTGAVFGNALSIAELGVAGEVWAMDVETGEISCGWEMV